MKNSIRTKLSLLGGMIPIGDDFLPMEESELVALEQKYEFSLPDDYKDFLLTFGASMFTEYIDFELIERVPSTISEDGKAHIASFYGSPNDPRRPLSKAIETFRSRMPDTMIPIGDDSGNKICLGVHGADNGAVFYWDQQNEPLDEDEYFSDFGRPRSKEVEYQNVYRIANSFEEFIMKLEVRPE